MEPGRLKNEEDSDSAPSSDGGPWYAEAGFGLRKKQKKETASLSVADRVSLRNYVHPYVWPQAVVLPCGSIYVPVFV